MKNYQTSEFKAKVKRLSINQSPNLRFELFTEMFPTENFQKILIRENEFCSFEESPLGLFCANEKCGQKPFENKIIMCRGKQGFHRGTLRHRVRIFVNLIRFGELYSWITIDAVDFFQRSLNYLIFLHVLTWRHFPIRSARRNIGSDIFEPWDRRHVEACHNKPNMGTSGNLGLPVQLYEKPF